MKKVEAKKLREGDIVVERITRARFRFTRIAEVRTSEWRADGFTLPQCDEKLRCEKILGEEYPACYRQDVPYYFSHLRLELENPACLEKKGE